MESKLKDKLRRAYRMVKYRIKSPELEFEEQTLPWIDRSDADIDAFVRQFKIPVGFPYDLAQLLRDWQDKGYVILEKAIPVEWLDGLWEEVEEVIENHAKYSLKSLVYQFNDGKETPIKEVPKEKLSAIGARLLEYHSSSIAAKRVMTYPCLATFLEAIFNEQVAVMQSLVFKYGSQQGTHQDFPWVRSKIPSHLAAAWIPLEDVDPDSGPLYYYPGSHRLPKFNFGTGILYKPDSFYSPDSFERYLDKVSEEHGIQKTTLLIKKGDVLLWHGALAHGGHRINQPGLTRRSFVCHYSTVRSYPKHRFEEGDQPSIASDYNGIRIYANPDNLAEEDSLIKGKNWS